MLVRSATQFFRTEFCRYRAVFTASCLVFINFVLLSVFGLSASQASTAQTFTLDGRLFDSNQLSNPLLDANVLLNVKILDRSGLCVLYEESQVVSTYSSNGYFNIQVGSVFPDGKRTGSDPHHAMRTVFQNRSSITASNPGCPGGAYLPSPGDGRLVRITVTPSSGVTEILSPDMVMDSVPMALVAESVQGLERSQILELGTVPDLTQARFESVFSTTNYPKLSSLLAGSSSDYVARSANGAAAMPAYAGNPASPAAGQVWLDTSTGQLKFHDGTVTQSLSSGTMIGGVSSLNGLTSGTQYFAIGASGTEPAFSSAGTVHTLNIPLAVDAGVTAGLISKTQYNMFDAKLSSTLNSGEIFVGNASNVATGVAPSGDVTMSNTGVVTLAASGVTAGSYTKVQVDSKGRVIAGFPLLALDIPGLAASHITAGTLSIARGGTGTGAIPTNGQLLIGNGTDYTLSTLTAGTGVAITNAAGSITINATGSGGTVTQVTGGAGLEGGTITGTGTLSLSTTGIAVGTYTKLSVDAYGRSVASASLDASDIPDLNASKITSGTFAVARIPDLDAAKIMSGTFATMRVPDLDASKITSGTLTTARLPFGVIYDGGNSPASPLIIGTNNAQSVSLETNDVTRLTIDSSGNVGIGTTTPVNTLHVASGKAVFPNGSFGVPGITFTGNNNVGLQLYSSDGMGFVTGSSGTLSWIVDSGALRSSNGNGAAIAHRGSVSSPSGPVFYRSGDSDTGIYMPVDNEMGFSTGGVARIYVNAAGNVGIGTTSPVTTLGVAGAILAGDDATCAADRYGAIRVNAGNLQVCLTNSTWSNLAASGATGTVTQVTAGAGLDGGTITTTGTIALATTGITAGTYAKVTVDAYGRAISGGTLSAADLPSNVVLDGGNTIASGTLEIGTNSLHGLSLRTNGATQMHVGSNGRVGIGTTTPSVLFHVAGDAAINGYAQFSMGNSGAPSLTFVNDTDTGIYNESSNQIGFTTGGAKKFEINSSGLTGNNGGAYIRSGIGDASFPTFTFRSDTDNGLFSPATDTIAFSTVGVERIRVGTNGNVGIGTTSPETKLQVSGAILAGDDTTCASGKYGAIRVNSNVLEVCLASNTWSALSTSGATGTVTQITAGAGLDGGTITTTGTIALATTGITAAAYPKVTVDTYGRVVAGSTLAAADVPDLDAAKITTGTLASARLPSNVILDGGNSTGAAVVVGTNDNQQLQLETNNATRVTIGTNGDVGIGTTAPVSKLQIGSGNLRVDNGYGLEFNGSTNGVKGQQSGSSYVHTFSGGSIRNYIDVNNNSADSFEIYGNTAEGTTTGALFTVLDTGNVGVGTTTPNSKFQVVGAVQPGDDAAACAAEKNGAIRFNSGSLQVCLSTTWATLSTGTASGDINNGGNTTGAAVVIGTNDNFDLVLKTNNWNSVRFNADGDINFGDGSTLYSGQRKFNFLSNPWNETGDFAHINNDAYFNSAANTGTVSGIRNWLRSDTSNNHNNMYSSHNLVDHFNSGTLTSAVGSYNHVSNHTGTTTSATGAVSLISGNGGTITNAYGFRAQTAGGATITNAYGVYVDSLVGTNKWGIYQAGASDRNYFAGNVGIGTTTPSEVLSISGNLTASGAGMYRGAFNPTFGTGIGIGYSSPHTAGLVGSYAVTSGTANTIDTIVSGSNLRFFTGSGNILGITEKMRLTTAGSLGIGTTTPNSLLQVVGAIQPGDDVAACATSKNGAIRFNGGNLQVCLSTTWTTLSTGGGGTPAGATTQVQFNSSGTFGANSNFVWNNTNGRLGIGVASPTQKLHVADTVGSGGTVQALLGNYSTTGKAEWVVGADTGWAGLSVLGSAHSYTTMRNNTLLGSSHHLYLGTDQGVASGGSSEIRFVTGGWDLANLQRMVITSAGNVGIGTASPSAKLHLEGSANFYNGQVTMARWQDGWSSTAFDNSNSGANAAVALDLSNDVGPIGTIWVGSSNHSSTQARSRLSVQAASPNSSGLNLVAASATGDIRFMAGGVASERMRLTNTGNLGIGTTSPGEKLEVNGNVRIGTQTSRTVSSNRGQMAQGSTYVATVNASTTVDWDRGNIQELNTFACDGAKTITMSNLKDGAAYTLLLSGTAAHSGICIFSAGGYTFKTQGGGFVPTANRDVIITFVVINTTVVYSMTDNLQ